MTTNTTQMVETWPGGRGMRLGKEYMKLTHLRSWTMNNVSPAIISALRMIVDNESAMFMTVVSCFC